MVNEQVLVSNRRHLEENLERVEEFLAHSDDGTFCKGDEEFERGDALNQKAVARQNHKATKELRDNMVVALKRMEEGTYGICVDCGGEINEDRLIALPYAGTCLACQKKRGLKIK